MNTVGEGNLINNFGFLLDDKVQTSTCAQLQVRRQHWMVAAASEDSLQYSISKVVELLV
jgi:hypothetical protein